MARYLSQDITIRVFQFSAILFILFTLIGGLYLFQTTYIEFIHLISWLSAYEKTDKIKAFISVEKFNALWIILFLASLAGFAALFLSKKIFHLTSTHYTAFVSLINDFKVKIKQLRKLEKISLISLILFGLGVRLYLAVTMPISYDEAWTFLNFTSKSFLVSMAYYPAPNNHILHSIFTNITAILPVSTILSLRIPAIIINIISVALFFLLLKALTSFRISIILTTLYSVLFPVLYYGYLSRGYSLLLLAFIICYAATNCLLNKKNKLKLNHYILLSLGGIIGFYTIPSFLYPYLSLISFLAFYLLYKKEYHALKYLFVSCLVTGICTIVLYTPVFLFSGVNAVTNNKFVASIDRKEVIGQLWSHFESTFNYLFSFRYALVVVIAISLVLLVKRQLRKEILLNVYVLIFSPIILVIHSVLPFERTWIYLIIPCLVLTGYLFQEIAWFKFSKANLPPVALNILFLLIMAHSFTRKIKSYESFSYAAETAAGYLIQEKVSNVFIHHPLAETNILFEFISKDIPITIHYSQHEFTEDISTKFDVLIVEKKIDDLKYYNPITLNHQDFYMYKRRQN